MGPKPRQIHVGRACIVLSHAQEPGMLSFSQRIKQMPQRVVVEFIHQLDQAAKFAGWKTFPRKPVEVMSRQIGKQATFVLPIGRFNG